jgi:hypothetical protein
MIMWFAENLGVLNEKRCKLQNKHYLFRILEQITILRTLSYQPGLL